MSTEPILGITVTAQAEITDWEALGEHVAQASSPDQAAFLSGFCCRLDFRQPVYIAADVEKGNARDAVFDTLDAIRAALTQRAAR